MLVSLLSAEIYRIGTRVDSGMSLGSSIVYGSEEAQDTEEHRSRARSWASGSASGDHGGRISLDDGQSMPDHRRKERGGHSAQVQCIRTFETSGSMVAVAKRPTAVGRSGSFGRSGSDLRVPGAAIGIAGLPPVETERVHTGCYFLGSVLQLWHDQRSACHIDTVLPGPCRRVPSVSVYDRRARSHSRRQNENPVGRRRDKNARAL